MRAVLPRRLLVGAHPHPRLVHERRGLKRVLRGLACHLGGSDPAEFGVNEREELGTGGDVIRLAGESSHGDEVDALTLVETSAAALIDKSNVSY
jgi:hypothetical protein